MNFTEYIVSFITAALAGMGVGGGGLLVIYLSIFGKYEIENARFINLVFFLFCCLTSLPYQWKMKKIDFKMSVLLSVTGAVGAVFGSIVGKIITAVIIKKVFGGLMMLSGGIALWKNKNIFKKGLTSKKQSDNITK